ncbi:MAG: non-canonical purine NTP pyrophosphatase [Janthinobacterium lividum]
MTIYIATTNPGKLRDFRFAAEETGAAGIRIEPLPGVERFPAPDETGDTFEANARLKAVYYSRLAPGLWVLADDSGLEVDALEGRPGVRSARYATDVGFDLSSGVDAANNDAILLAMLEQTDRRAHYRCALALAMDGSVEQVSFGKLEGQLQAEPGEPGGFGYDPLFFVPELNCTMSEASPEDRLRVSHRGRALRALLRQWKPC